MPKREKIIDGSIKHFVRKGFNHTTVQEMTKATGLSKGSFYRHSAGKDKLLMQEGERLAELSCNHSLPGCVAVVMAFRLTNY